MKEAASRAASLTPSPPDAESLHAALFQKALQDALSQVEAVPGAEAPLLRLMPQDSHLQAVPWEALCRPGTGRDFVGASREVCLVRGVHSTKPWQPREVRGAVRLLVISPFDEAAPARLRAALYPSIEVGELEWLDSLTGPRATVAEVLDRLRHEPLPHIVHFIGHGGFDEAQVPRLRLADKGGQESWLAVGALAAELEMALRNLRLIILEGAPMGQPGALASAAERLAQAGADAVVAHLWPMQEEVSRRFSVGLYRALAGASEPSGDVARSLHEARRRVLEDFKGSAEAFSPVLYLRGRDSRLFDIRRPKGEPRSVQARAETAETNASPQGSVSLELWLSVPDPAALSREQLAESLASSYGARVAAPAFQERRFILPLKLPRQVLPQLLQDAESGALDRLLGQVGGRFAQEIREGSRCLFSHVPSTSFAPPPRFEDVSPEELKALLPQVDVVLLTTTEVERQALYEALKPFPGRAGLIEGALHNNTYRLGQFGRYVVAHVQSTMGSQARDGSMLTVRDAISEISPKAVVIIGIAFGLRPEKQRLGDVIIAETVVPYELQRVGEKTVHRGQPLACGPILSERFRTRREDWSLARGEDVVRVFQGPLLSGEKLTDNHAFRDALTEAFPTAHAGEMEGAGAYAVTERMGVEVILVKAICDWADGTKSDRAQPFAARAAVSLSQHVLAKRAVLEPLKIRESTSPAEPLTAAPVVLADDPAVRSLRELLRQPFSLLLGDSLLGDAWSTAVEGFRQALRDSLQKKAWVTPEGLPLSALTQRYALQFGAARLNSLFQSVFKDDLPALPLVDALAHWIQPGFHLTLLRLPVLEYALARHHSELPLYVIHPLRPGEDSPLIQRHVSGQTWVTLEEMPDALDPQRDVILLRLYRGYLPDKGFDTPLLTEDDYLSSLGGLEDVLPEDLANELRSTLHERPSLMWGLSLLSWDHRHVLQSLFGRRSLHPRSTVLLEPGNIEADSWRKGRSVPGDTRVQVVSKATAELAQALGLTPSGGSP